MVPGIVYLSKNPEPRYRNFNLSSKERITHYNTKRIQIKQSHYLEQISDEEYDQAFDAMMEQYEETVTIENVYNRLVLFNGKTHHGVKTFGSKPRLTLNFFGMGMSSIPPLQRSKMKIAIITDQHFGARKSSRIFHDYFNKFYTNVFFPTLKKRDRHSIGFRRYL